MKRLPIILIILITLFILKSLNNFSQIIKKPLYQDLYIEKTDKRDFIEPNGKLTYKITYGNKLSDTAYNVIITDIIPKYTKYLSKETSPLPDIVDTTEDGKIKLIWKNIDPIIPPNTDRIEAITLNLQVEDQKNLPPGTNTLLNIIKITNPYENDEGFDVTKVTTLADLSIEKSDYKTTAEPGDVITYKITFRNNGAKDAYNVILNDAIPAYTTFISADNLGDTLSGGRTVKWELEAVPAYSSLNVLEIKVRIDSLIPLGTIPLINRASIFTPDDEIDKNNNNAIDYTDVTAFRDLEITKKDDGYDSISAGEILKYEISYQNTGNVPARNVVLIDTLPEYTRFDSASKYGEYDSTSHTVTWNLGTIQATSGITKKWIKVIVYDETELPVEINLINNAAISTTDPEDKDTNNENMDMTVVKGDSFHVTIKAKPKEKNKEDRFFLKSCVLFEIVANKTVQKDKCNINITTPNDETEPFTTKSFVLQPHETHECDCFIPDMNGIFKVSITATNIFNEEAYAEDLFEVIGNLYLNLDRNIFYPDGDNELPIYYGIGRPGEMSISVYTITGVLVKNIYLGYTDRIEGYYTWDCKNKNNQDIACGVFIITIDSDLIKKWKKIIVIR
jgi:uncharacterized repeat protein (TIGR01451 family)